MFADDIGIEEELGSCWALSKEIASGGGNPSEDATSCSCLEDEKGNYLLHKETDDDGWPWDGFTIMREEVERALEYQKSNH
jgi:hypothetical protein